jgi:2-polyprenyl-3-methyl-5-hydroxy-6-metoxy-1,4-benzoquinol methylase
MSATAEPMCPVCRRGRAAPLFSKDGVDYWKCPDCDFRFATPDRNPNLANTLDQYEDAYLQYLAPDPADAVNFDALYRWMSSVDPLDGKRLLDVGAGGGKLVRYLRQRGVDAHGIEPSRALFDRFLAGDSAFTCASLDDDRLAAGSFSVVTAFDVIEHVADPVAFLQRIAAMLGRDGVFFLSTPDVESLTAKLFGRRWHFYYPYHLSYFGMRTVARTAAAAGLRAVRSGHHGRRRSVGYMIRYAAEFIGGVDAPKWARRFDAWYLPVNLFDTMYVAFRRE